MYQFQIIASTKAGETIGLVGSRPELGNWDAQNYVPLRTSPDRYPLWWTDEPIDLATSLAAAVRSAEAAGPDPDSPAPFQACTGAVELVDDAALAYPIEYKYVRISATGAVEWEAWGANRWLPIDLREATSTTPGTAPATTPQTTPPVILVDDGAFGYVQPSPFGQVVAGEMPTLTGDRSTPIVPTPTPAVGSVAGDFAGDLRFTPGLKVAIVGSSVALGQKAWLLQGWAARLAKTLQAKYGHQVVNCSEAGAGVTRTIERLPGILAAERPDVVVIALSLGNEGLASCLPHQRRAVQQRFESGLQYLIQLIRQQGARPILGAVYPHNDYSPEHYWLLLDTHRRMLAWDVAILDWLPVLDDGTGRWQAGLSFDPAHPNTIGHDRMANTIDLSLFAIHRDDLLRDRERFRQPQELPVYLDPYGFRLFATVTEKRLRLGNTSSHDYTIAPYWQEVQTALKERANLVPGLYLAEAPQPGSVPSFLVTAEGTIETTIAVAPGSNLTYRALSAWVAPNPANLLFYDGNLALLKVNDRQLWIINETDRAYNIHPMWQEIRTIFKAMPTGVYHDPLAPDAPFRTLMIGPDGLASRVKAPARSALLMEYRCALADLSRVGIVPLGDRCAVRMMLYKMEYDGPAYPFDLTRTTRLADVADAIANRFADMWNPAYLHYSAQAGRIYHSKWTGLSFAHEVEPTDDPVRDMSPVFDRMKTRYSARSERFWYTLAQADELLFVRTGLADRPAVLDLLAKLEAASHNKPFRLLILSPQDSTEFADLPQVIHYDYDFNPDHMYDNLDHWLYCTEIFRTILESLDVSSKNLFWCPSKLSGAS